MKTLKLVAILSIVVAILGTSCGVEKRRYRKGYNVDKTKKNEKADEKDVKTDATPEPAKTTTTNTPAPEKKVEPAATTTVKGTNGAYEFKVVEGPRTDKKGKKKKYPMNMR